MISSKRIYCQRSRFKAPSILIVMMLLGGVLFCPLSLEAQETAAIQGRVIDARTGDPLPGATVFINELNIGAATNVKGEFTFLVPGPQVRGQVVTLIVRYVGYKQKMERITLTPGIISKDFKLDEDIFQLEEVVVTGVVGGTFKERLPFVVERIGKIDLQQVPHTSVHNAIRGKVPGVLVVQGDATPGSAASIQLRGPSSINTVGRSVGPLFIVDGVILAGSIADLDALNIESIEIVKGPAAASLYGSRAQAGIIQIKTIRADHLAEGQTRFTLRNEVGKSSLERKIRLRKNHMYYIDPVKGWVDAQGNPVSRDARVVQYYTFGRYWDPTARGGAGDSVLAKPVAFQDKQYIGKLYDQIDEFFDPGLSYTNTLTASHRSRHTSLAVSLINEREGGIIWGLNGYRAHRFRLNLDHKLLKGLDLSLSAYHSTSLSDEVPDAVGSPFFDLTFMPPDIDLRTPNPDGTPFIIFPDPVSLEENPLYALHFAEHTQRRKRTMGSFTLRYVPFSFGNIEANLSYDRLDRVDSEYYPKGFKTRIAGRVNLGQLEKYHMGLEGLNGNITGSFNYNIGVLTTRTQLRYLFEREVSRGFNAYGWNFAVRDVPSLDVTGTEGRIVGSQKEEIRSEGYYFITAFDYGGKYITDFLVRRDGSSLFGSEERWHTYYRASAAYRIAQEPWWPVANIINEFKLRYSIGTAGGRPNFFAQYETWSVVGGKTTFGTLGNKRLKPERSTEHETGVNLGIMDRIFLEATYSRSKKDDQILLVPLPAFMGYTDQWQNAGTLETNTIEASLKAFIVQTPDISWSANVLFDRTRQTITKLNRPPYRRGDRSAFYVREGEQLGTFYGQKWVTKFEELPKHIRTPENAKMWQVNNDGYLVPVGIGNSWKDGIKKGLWGTKVFMRDTAGVWVSYDWGIPIIYVDDNGNNFHRLGTVVPDFNIAFSSTFRWKGLTLYVLFDGQIGGNIYNATRQWAYRNTASGDQDQYGVSDELKKTYDYHMALYLGNHVNSHFVEDATYLKLREVSISYTFGKSQLAPIFGDWLQRITVSLIGRNIKTWTSYKGYDPETGTGVATLDRIDYYTYPNFRTFTGTVEIEL